MLLLFGVPDSTLRVVLCCAVLWFGCGGGGRLGHTAVKYSFRPCAVNPNRAALDRAHRSGDSFLREAMRRHLDPFQALPDSWGYDSVCFELLVQEQGQPCREPVEDPTKAWGGPWIPVATLTIPKQQFLARDQTAFCDALRFNPWHAPRSHRPLGTINLARKLTYFRGGAKRNALNQVANAREPDGSEEFVMSQVGALF